MEFTAGLDIVGPHQFPVFMVQQPGGNRLASVLFKVELGKQALEILGLVVVVPQAVGAAIDNVVHIREPVSKGDCGRKQEILVLIQMYPFQQAVVASQKFVYGEAVLAVGADSVLNKGAACLKHPGSVYIDVLQGPDIFCNCLPDLSVQRFVGERLFQRPLLVLRGRGDLFDVVVDPGILMEDIVEFLFGHFIAHEDLQVLLLDDGRPGTKRPEQFQLRPLLCAAVDGSDLLHGLSGHPACRHIPDDLLGDPGDKLPQVYRFHIHGARPFLHIVQPDRASGQLFEHILDLRCAILSYAPKFGQVVRRQANQPAYRTVSVSAQHIGHPDGDVQLAYRGLVVQGAFGNDWLLGRLEGGGRFYFQK